MCLLIVMFQVVPGAPLVVAANRDERLERPAVAMTVLAESGPRILGGRDQLAGGTWLAVAQHGLVAGLTNRPVADGRDPAKRSRGELPLACAGHDSAAEAVAALARETDPRAYNPCWMLVGDREALFALSLEPDAAAVQAEQLQPGLHVLENAPLHAASAKAAFVRDLVARALERQGDDGPQATTAALRQVLADHTPADPQPRTRPGGRVRPPEVSAACVHGDGYGTRSALVAVVPAAGPPQVQVAGGPPCRTPFTDVTALWQPPA